MMAPITLLDMLTDVGLVSLKGLLSLNDYQQLRGLPSSIELSNPILFEKMSSSMDTNKRGSPNPRLLPPVQGNGIAGAAIGVKDLSYLCKLFRYCCKPFRYCCIWRFALHHWHFSGTLLSSYLQRDAFIHLFPGYRVSPTKPEMDKNASAEQQTTGTKSSGSIASLTQEQPTSSNAIDISGISLPKGGGALKGIDEKFEVNAANGTAGFSV